jgi:Metallo-peptidase family M12B Reprolysin-like
MNDGDSTVNSLAVDNIYTKTGQERQSDYSLPYIENLDIPSTATATPVVPPVDFINTFKLHSNPNAKHTIYLDFNGHITENTGWNSSTKPKIESPAYDTDGNPSLFSNEELQTIQRIWQRTIEDFSPFEVDVTTEEPNIEDLKRTGNGDQKWGIRVVITQDNITQISPGKGGAAFVGNFNSSIAEPIFVFYRGEIAAAETVSHEVGHSLGLSHDTLNATDTQVRQEYYVGHGSGNTST